MTTTRMRRLAATLVAMIAALAPFAARADAPSNDRPSGAMLADPLPFSHLADYTSATWSDDEPIPCWNPVSQLPVNPPGMGGSQTLWYRYDATERIGLLAGGYRVVNENGYLDLGAYRATDEGLELVGCVSSNPSSNWTDEVLIRAEPGETYLFMMSMVTYPDDTMASFHLRSTDPVDLEARSLGVTDVEHETDVGSITTHEELDFSFDIASMSEGRYYVSAAWTLDVCTRPLVPGTERCQAFTGALSVPPGEVQTGTHRITGLGLGDFEATLSVIPAWGVDPDATNDRRSISFSVLVEGLGFGV